MCTCTVTRYPMSTAPTRLVACVACSQVLGMNNLAGVLTMDGSSIRKGLHLKSHASLWAATSRLCETPIGLIRRAYFRAHPSVRIRPACVRSVPLAALATSTATATFVKVCSAELG